MKRKRSPPKLAYSVLMHRLSNYSDFAGLPVQQGRDHTEHIVLLLPELSGDRVGGPVQLLLLDGVVPGEVPGKAAPQNAFDCANRFGILGHQGVNYEEAAIGSSQNHGA